MTPLGTRSRVEKQRCMVGRAWLFSPSIYHIKEENTMSYTPQEQSEIRCRAALDLLAHKMIKRMKKNENYGLDYEEVNEVFMVAGLPLLVPEQIQNKELKVIEINTEDAE